MIDTGKRYYIVDTSGNYYRLNDKNSLVIARNSSEATLFTIREANARIGTGRRARFYNLLEADTAPMPVEVSASEPEESYDAPELEAFETPTMFDGSVITWWTFRNTFRYYEFNGMCAAYDDTLRTLYLYAVQDDEPSEE